MLQRGPLAADRGQFRDGGQVGRGGEAGVEGRHAGVDRGGALFLQRLFDHGLHGFGRQADHRGDGAQRDHVGTAVLDLCRDVRHRQRRLPRLASQQSGGGVAVSRIADDQAVGGERNLGREARDVVPVDRHQQVEAVVVRHDRFGGEAQHGGGLAAADLRARGAAHQGIPAGLGRRVEQQRTGGNHPGAAAAGNDQRNTVDCHEHPPPDFAAISIRGLLV
jgi:hypothetical protein